MNRINQTITNAKNQVKDLIGKWQQNELEIQPGRSMSEVCCVQEAVHV
jgi:DNA-directed RNA polymerase II subunit RPB1